MTDRFSSMIGIMNTCIKNSSTSCEVPTNRLSTNMLILLRERGYIYGFSEVSPGKKKGRLFPRVRIFFKYVDGATPILKTIKVFKHTRSNFYILHKNNLNRILIKHKLYILSTTRGLTITSLEEIYRNLKAPSQRIFSGKILAQIMI